MLKLLTLKNFVKFKEAQTIHFGEGGAFIFVGPNGSGKSSMAEALRRCSELSANRTISSRKIDDEESIAICIFKRKNKKNEEEKMVSCYMAWENLVMKVLTFCRPGNQGECKVALGKLNERKGVEWCVYESMEAHAIQSACNDIGGPRIDEQLANISTILRKVHKNVTNGTMYKLEDFDETIIDFTKTEFIFAHRGISPIQSSEQYKFKRPENRYTSASGSAYIIKAYLEDEETSRYDRTKRREIFDLVTSSKNSVFKFDEKKSIMFRADGDDNDISILKVSEGVVEAMNFSILLSKTEMNTLVLEELGRGMHKDFIDILVHRVLTQPNYTEQKTVILTTHNRDFLTPATLKNTIFFSKNDDGSCRTNRLNINLTRKTCTFITDDTVASIFFSRHCIFVEGLTDSIFVKALKKVLLDESSMMDEICENEADRESFRNFLATLNVIDIGGHKSKKMAESVCVALDIKDGRRYYLLDGDTKDEVQTELLENEKVETDLASLEKYKGIFLWDPDGYELPKKIKKGTLEHALHETLLAHLDRDSNQLCKIEGCTACENLKELEKKGKKLLSGAETDKLVETFIKTLVDISLNKKTKQIWRFIQFLKYKSSKRQSS